MYTSVTVSVVTIKGEECRVMELGQVADATGGNVRVLMMTFNNFALNLIHLGNES